MKPTYVPLIVFALFIASCGICTYRNDCPAFNNPAFFHWFPYSPGQRLIFKNPVGVKDTITIQSVDSSASYSFKSKSPSENCSMFARIASKELINPDFNKLYVREEDGNLFSLELFSSRIVAPRIDTLGISNATYWADTLITHYSLQGTVYDTIQVLKNTDTSAGKGPISQIYLSPGHGIVAYELFSGNERWLLQ